MGKEGIERIYSRKVLEKERENKKKGERKRVRKRQQRKRKTLGIRNGESEWDSYYHQ